MTITHSHWAWPLVTLKSTALLSLTMLSGCLLNDGSDLIPKEENTTPSSGLIVGAGVSPSYVWTIGSISFLDVVRTSNPNSPVWGFNVAGGADVVVSPVTHGQVPVGATAIAGSEPILTAGVQYRVRIQRNTTNQQISAVFTPPVGTGAALTSAALASGTSWVWGANGGASAMGEAPSERNGLDHVVALAAGGSHSIALDTDGSVWSWGANGSGQLGTGNNADSATPVRVPGLPRITAVAAGELHTLALAQDGTVWAWGDNGSSQLGDGTTVNRNTPVRVEFLAGVKAIAAGKVHSMALTADGTVWSWGGNYNGQLGDGTTANSAQPVAAKTH